jgi:hypothetical protein
MKYIWGIVAILIFASAVASEQYEHMWVSLVAFAFSDLADIKAEIRKLKAGETNQPLS